MESITYLGSKNLGFQLEKQQIVQFHPKISFLKNAIFYLPKFQKYFLTM